MVTDPTMLLGLFRDGKVRDISSMIAKVAKHQHF
jgi:hypothetical protein